MNGPPDKREELLSCPFCKSEMHEDDMSGDRNPENPVYWIECGYCGSQGPTSTHKGAASAWNERATTTPPAAPTVEQARAQVEAFNQAEIKAEHIRLAALQQGLMRPHGDAAQLQAEWYGKDAEIATLKNQIEELKVELKAALKKICYTHNSPCCCVYHERLRELSCQPIRGDKIKFMKMYGVIDLLNETVKVEIMCYCKTHAMVRRKGKIPFIVKRNEIYSNDLPSLTKKIK